MWHYKKKNYFLNVRGFPEKFCESWIVQSEVDRCSLRSALPFPARFAGRVTSRDPLRHALLRSKRSLCLAFASTTRAEYLGVARTFLLANTATESVRTRVCRECPRKYRECECDALTNGINRWRLRFALPTPTRRVIGRQRRLPRVTPVRPRFIRARRITGISHRKRRGKYRMDC